jgi:hypothetical protein
VLQAVPEGDVAGRAVAEGLLSQALGKLMAVAEAYPDLKANQNFLQLQETLDKIEGEVQMSRRYYNGAARDLNVKVESFPSNFVANYFKFDHGRVLRDRETLPTDRYRKSVSEGERPMKTVVKLLVACIASLWLATAAIAEEVIQLFDSRLVLSNDGGMEVTETITVIGEGRKIRRGIYRDFPIVFRDGSGRERKVQFDVVSVTRDGQPEDFHVKQAKPRHASVHRQCRPAHRPWPVHLPDHLSY